MIKYVKGDLLSSETEALVNTVNTVGVMGKGIALRFKELYPSNYHEYYHACKQGKVVTGKMFVTIDSRMGEGRKLIINFPTKTEFYRKSSYKYIEEGLQDLVKVIREYNIKSISLPPLGCGNGGLDWTKVQSLIEEYLSPLEDVEILVYEPNEAIKELLKKQDTGNKKELTDSGAMLMYAMFYYEGLGESPNLFVANKLVYFLQRLGEKNFSRINFKAHYYGPYAPQVAHILKRLNGNYIRGLEQMDAKAFEELTLDYSKVDEISKYIRTQLKPEQAQRLVNLTKLINGFQSFFALEILSTVDFIRKDNRGISIEDTLKKIEQWSERKKEMFNINHVRIAYERLNTYENSLL